MDYLWLKALHVAAVLIFVPGLLVQAIGVVAGAHGAAAAVELVSTWDRRVTLPAMLAVWLTGVLVAVGGGWFAFHWLQLKLVLVVGLSGLHGIQSGRLRRLRAGDRGAARAGSYRVPIGIVGAVAIIAVLAVTKLF